MKSHCEHTPRRVPGLQQKFDKSQLYVGPKEVHRSSPTVNPASIGNCKRHRHGLDGFISLYALRSCEQR